MLVKQKPGLLFPQLPAGIMLNPGAGITGNEWLRERVLLRLGATLTGGGGVQSETASPKRQLQVPGLPHTVNLLDCASRCMAPGVQPHASERCMHCHTAGRQVYTPGSACSWHVGCCADKVVLQQLRPHSMLPGKQVRTLKLARVPRHQTG